MSQALYNSQNVPKRGCCQRRDMGQCLRSRVCFSKSSFPVEVNIRTHRKTFWKKNYWSFLLLDFRVKMKVIYKLTWFLASSCPPQRGVNGSCHEELPPPQFKAQLFAVLMNSHTLVFVVLMNSHTLVITAPFINAQCKCWEGVLLEERAMAVLEDVCRLTASAQKSQGDVWFILLLWKTCVWMVCYQRKGWNYSEFRLNRQVLPSPSVFSSLLFFLCPHFSPSASWASLVV